MRLVCPNCAAQYEVEASLIPAEGTEVQCSACATVWFHGAPERAVVTPRPVAPTRPARPETERPPTATSGPASDGPVAAPAAVDKPPSQRPRPDPAPEATRASVAAEPPARALDPSVAEVLREEAAFEARQRARESTPLETQEELGLFGPVGISDSGAQRGGAARLPDIDDISATLEPIDSSRAGQSGLPQTESVRKRQFLGGLVVPVGLAGVMTALYLAAPMLAQAVPALDGVLGSFVALVDRARMGVAGLIGAAP